MSSPFLILCIPPTNDVRAIKRAYAAALKLCQPEDNPEGFKELRKAYEKALEGARSGWWLPEESKKNPAVDEQYFDDVAEYFLRTEGVHIAREDAADQNSAPEPSAPADTPEQKSSESELLSDMRWAYRDKSLEENQQSKFEEPIDPAISWPVRTPEVDPIAVRQPQVIEDELGPDPETLADQLTSGLNALIRDGTLAQPSARARLLQHPAFEHFEAKRLAEVAIVEAIVDVPASDSLMPAIADFAHELDKVYVWFGHDRRLVKRVPNASIDRLLEILQIRRREIAQEEDTSLLKKQGDLVFRNEALRRIKSDRLVVLYGTATYITLLLFLSFANTSATKRLQICLFGFLFIAALFAKVFKKSSATTLSKTSGTANSQRSSN